MRPIAVLRLPVQIDLSEFIALLRRLQVPYRVSEEAGEQVLWVPSEQLAEQVRELYRRYPQGDPALRVAAGPSPVAGVLRQLRDSAMTSAMLGLTLLVAVLTWFGDNLALVRWLSFVDFRIQGDYLYFAYLGEMLATGQWWRLVTPMLIHFGVLHLTMNALWYWILGRRIEARQGGWVLLGLTLLFGLVSNLAQYLYTGPSLFGGLSGVLYGLLGHCWIYQRLAPNRDYRLPPGVVAMLLGWLLICMTGIFELLQFAAIANAAHVGGLLTGCFAGLLGGALARRRG